MVLARNALLSGLTRSRGAWRSCVVLLMALSLAFTLTLSAGHVHKSEAAAHDCAVCSAVVDQLGDVPPPPVLVAAVRYLPYLIIPAPVVLAGALGATVLLPPSCGPPSASV